ncbi:MAG: AraC family transcriptional regulator, partial [Pseudomonadota bacterium]
MSGSYETRILRVVGHIHDHCDRDLSLDALADIAAMSRFHWHRVYHAMTGETCAQTVRRVRMHRAACRLVQSQDTVDCIATQCGYDNAQSFSRTFRGLYGLTPAAYRDQGALPPPSTHPGKGDHAMHPIEILEQPARRLAALPHKGAYIKIGREFESLHPLLSSQDLMKHVRGMVGVYYDDPNSVAEEDLRSHAGAVLENDAAIAAPLEEVLLPSGRYAVMHHKGPYSGLKAAYDYLYGSWLPQSGEEAGDHPPIEVYLNAPQNTPPDELLTDV